MAELNPMKEILKVRAMWKKEIIPCYILHVCKQCGWVGKYDELDRGEIGTYGYSEEPKCPRCHSNI